MNWARLFQVPTLELIRRLDARSQTDACMPYDNGTAKIVKRLQEHETHAPSAICPRGVCRRDAEDCQDAHQGGRAGADDQVRRSWRYGNAGRRRRIVGDGEAGLSHLVLAFIQFVRFFGGARTREPADGPELATVHVGINPAGKWRLPRQPQIFLFVEIVQIRRGIQRADGDPGTRIERLLRSLLGHSLIIRHRGTSPSR